MPEVPRWRRYLRFLRPDVDADVDDELRFHFDARIAELTGQGKSPSVARAQALEEFGDVEATREGLRAIDRRIEQAQRRSERFSSLLQDLRLAARSLVLTPAFSIAAILTIALGVGVNSVIFSAVHAVLLRPLPFPEPGELVRLREKSGYRDGTVMTVSPANFIDYRSDNRVFSGLAGFTLEPMNLTGDGAPRRVWVNRVTAGFFGVLGQPLERGREFVTADDIPGNEYVTILSHELWRELGADTAMPGRTIRLSDHDYQVIGILPAGFQSPGQFGFSVHIGLYVPAAYRADVLAPAGRGDHDIDVVARMRPGVTLEQAQADMDRVSRALGRLYPETNARMSTSLDLLHEAVVGGDIRTSLLVLLGAVGLVWLVACVNLANLLLVRALGRQREVTVRVALGASRARIVQALVAHSVLLALLGCAVGLVLGTILRSVLVRFAPADIPRLDTITMNGSVFAVTASLSLLAGIVFGLFPAWHVSSVQPAQSLRASERGSAGHSVLRWQRALVVAEVALSFVLLIGSGLLLRSFVTLMGVDLGFETHSVLAANITLPQRRYPGNPERLRFFQALEPRLAAIPGVQAVGYTNRLPLRGGWGSGVHIEPAGDDTTGIPTEANMQAVSPGYFPALGISLLRGRMIEASDRDSTVPVALVNAEFARLFFRGGDPLGRRFKRGGPFVTIVGVVGDIRRGGKTDQILPEVYIPAAQTGSYPVRLSDVAVRTIGNPNDVLPQVRAAVLSIDPDQPVANAHSLDDVIDDAVAPRRFEAMLLLMFAGVALLLAIVGIYGVVSYSVSQRTPEFGIRVALGAVGGDIVRMVLKQAGLLIAIGLVAGLAGSLALARFLTTLLFEIRPTDPLTYGGVAALLAVVAMAACYVPARRASRADPMSALRSE